MMNDSTVWARLSLALRDLASVAEKKAGVGDVVLTRGDVMAIATAVQGHRGPATANEIADAIEREIRSRQFSSGGGRRILLVG